jgi:hypothetical protein
MPATGSAHDGGAVLSQSPQHRWPAEGDAEGNARAAETWLIGAEERPRLINSNCWARTCSVPSSAADRRKNPSLLNGLRGKSSLITRGRDLL